MDAPPARTWIDDGKVAAPESTKTLPEVIVTSPVDRTISPAAPVDAWPVLIDIAPEFPSDAVPVDTNVEPVRGEADDITETAPDKVIGPFPDVTITDPPPLGEYR